MSIIRDPDLADVLLSATDEDVKFLIDVITDNGKGRISLSSSVCHRLTMAKETGVSELARAMVAEELTRFGGNSLMNIFRGGDGVSYKTLLSEVANHLGAAKTTGSDCAEIELAIVRKFFEHLIGRMSEEDRMTLFQSIGAIYRPGMGPAALAALIATLGLSGVASYRLAAVVAGATMSHLIGRGVVLAIGSSTLSEGLAVLAGPLGLAITGIWVVLDLASPAYRVIVPCVIQIAHMRQKMMLRPNPA
ncbi:YaaW family protein [Paraburkholderia sp. BCC1884]|uniref:YaaW family protein n=1 Tax=Paraburkholderia sp. BCC1884 TaxID=2562668 RepID=UPI001181E7AD|nr:ubiquinol-cytochrome C chaperone family protein [Paraburkholderia sp. BCC1884]